MSSVGLEVGIQDGHLNKGLHQDMAIDIGFNQVFVPNGKDGPFGIDCEEKDSCYPTGADQSCHYQNGGDQMVPCKAANALFRFSNTTLKDKNTYQSGFFYFKGDNAYKGRYSTRGILGLSPKSSFWSLLLNTYDYSSNQDHIDVSLYYNIDRKDKTYLLDKVDYSTSHLTINGRFTTTPLSFSDFNLAAQDVWAFPQVSIDVLNQGQTTANLCIDNSTMNAFFFTSTYAETIKSISQQLCGKDQGCKKSDSHVSKISTSQFVFKGDDEVKIEVTGDDLIGWDSNDDAIIGVRDLKDSPTCSNYPGAKIAAGHLFFTKAELIIRAKQGEKGTEFQIGVAKNNSPSYWIILILVFVLIGMIAFMVSMTFVMRKLLVKFGVLTAEEISGGSYQQTQLANSEQ